MTFINIPSEDEFTVHDNFYRLPEGMSDLDGWLIADECEARCSVDGVIVWGQFDAALAEHGIVPL
jgi:hypothetical protein